MRKIATIENEIARAETRIAKANEAIAKAETRLANAIAKCKKAGYEYKGDGKDVDRAYDMFHNWDIAWGPVRTADQARESIEKNKNAIFGSNYDLESLRKELAQANDKINSIPQAIKDYEPKLADSFIKDSKFRRDMTINEIAERKEDGRWVTREDACNAFEKANAVARRLDSAEWQEYDRIKAILKEQGYAHYSKTDRAIEHNKELWDMFNNGCYNTLTAFCKDYGLNIKIVAIGFKRFIPIYTKLKTSTKGIASNKSLVGVYK